MAFVTDHEVDGRRFRGLTVMNVFTRECLGLNRGNSPALPK